MTFPACLVTKEVDGNQYFKFIVIMLTKDSQEAISSNTFLIIVINVLCPFTTAPLYLIQ